MAKTPEGTYKCECGKEFLKSQSINAHYSRCKVHRGEKYVARSNDPFKNLSILERQAIYEKRDLHNRGRTLSEDHKTKISIGLENAETRPLKPNDTVEGRSSNRRIEIVIVPDLSSLPGFDELNKLAEEK
jgi:hypothetical protein